jgi:NitT/TauT family transport system substrate-binding protein
MKINKTFLILGTVILASVIGLLIINQLGKETKELSEPIIKIGYTRGSLRGFPLFVAQERRFFNEYGLNVQLKEMEASILIPAILSKEIDYFSFTIQAVKASLHGAPIKTVMNLMEHSFFALNTQPGLELNDIKSIGIMNWFGLSHYLALRTIKEHNLSAKIIASQSIQGAPALLITGQVDALVQDILSSLQLQKEGYPIVETFNHVKLAQGLTTSNDKIENHPEEVRKMIKAIQSSIAFIQNNPQETKELLWKYLGWEKDEDYQPMMEELYSNLVQGIAEGGTFTEEEINMLIKIGKTDEFNDLEDIEKQEVTEEDIAKAFDFRFLK